MSDFLSALDERVVVAHGEVGSVLRRRDLPLAWNTLTSLCVQ
jgi:hypothetical protein